MRVAPTPGSVDVALPTRIASWLAGAALAALRGAAVRGST